MKNSILEPAEIFNSKPALNFISNRVRECANNTTRGDAANFAPAPCFKRNFKFQDADARLNSIRGRNLKFYPASAGFAARNRASCDLAALYSAPHVKNIERKSTLNSVKVSVINPCKNSTRNFRQNFILNFMGNSTHSGANSASSLNRASVVDEPNLSPAKSLATAHMRRLKKNFTDILANDPVSASAPQPQRSNYGAALSPGAPQNFNTTQNFNSAKNLNSTKSSNSAQSFGQNSSSVRSRAQNPAPPSRLWDLGLLFVAIVWGCTFVPVQRALHSGDVFSFLFWRFLAASIFTYLACLRFGVKFDRGTIGRGVFCGLMLFCDFSCQTIALDYALSSTVAFILGLNVVIVPFLMLAFFGKKIAASAFGGAATALLGLYFLSGASGAVGFGIGERLTLVSAFAYALHIVFTGVCARKSNLYGFVIVQFICVCVCALIAAVFTPHAEFEGEIKVLGNLIFSPSFDFVFALVLTSIFATVAAFVIQTMAQNRGVSEIKTVLIFALEPVSAGIMGYAFGEKLSALQILGAALILAGILLSELGGLLGAKFAKDRACEKADRGD